VRAAKSRVLAGFWLALATCGAASPKFTCASCHRRESEIQARTPMGTSIELPGAQNVLRLHPKLTFTQNGYSYLVEYTDNGGRYTVSDGTDSLTLPIRYAVGVENQTFVLEHQGRLYESLVSYYTGVGGLAITMGSQRVRPHNLVEAMGRLLPDEEAVACFGCHSSGAVSQGRLQLDSLRPGLDCEHCHAGAAAHQEALEQGRAGVTPLRLSRVPAEEMSNFCGNCHRTWESVVRTRSWGQVNVRFQPYRLANSKCFVGDDRRIACTGCHDPHRELAREDAGYDASCAACHGAAIGEGKHWKPCPVGKSGCVGCHMLKVELPGSHSVFTDHYIRVLHPGDPYPN
jgi:hypothetical protein